MSDHITIPRALLEQALAAMTHKGHFPWTDKQYFVEAIRAELAKPPTGVAPAWHDAPTEPGIWLSRSSNRMRSLDAHDVEHMRKYPMKGARWYGPIPQDGEKS